jgi:hypothetical protein
VREGLSEGLGDGLGEAAAWDGAGLDVDLGGAATTGRGDGDGAGDAALDGAGRWGSV